MAASPTVGPTDRSQRACLYGALLASTASAALLYSTHRWAGQGWVLLDPRKVVFGAMIASLLAGALALAGMLGRRRIVRWLSLAVLAGQVPLMVVAAALLLAPRRPMMFTAIARGDEPGVRAALAWGISPNEISYWGWHLESPGETALTAAAKAGDVGIVRLLLDRGADPNRLDGFGSPPIHQATWAGREDVVRLLLDRGADPKLPDREGDTALHMAAAMGRVELMELFLDLGIDVNTRGRRGGTPLHRAALGNVEAAERLLRRGADPSLRDDDRRTPADAARALLWSHEENIRLYARGKPVDMTPVERLRRMIALIDNPIGVRD